MAKVKLLKNHNGNLKGTEVEVPDARVNYIIRCGIGEVVEESEDDKTTEEKKVAATTTKGKKDKNCRTC